MPRLPRQEKAKPRSAAEIARILAEMPTAPVGVTVSYSELDAFRQCPLKWWLGYNQRWSRPVKPDSALGKGTLWHLVMETHYKFLMAHRAATDGEPVDPEELELALVREHVIPQLLLSEGSGEWRSETHELIGWMYDGYCQPPGTLVTTIRDGAHVQVPIERVEPGDTVLSWRRKSKGVGWVRRRGSRVARVAQREYRGQLVSVRTDSDHASSYTADHLCVAVVEPAYRGRWVVYLMRRGDQYRVGMVAWRRGAEVRTHLGLVQRARQQGADAAWVLAVADTREEALVAEAWIAYTHNLPTWQFDGPTAEQFWAKVGGNKAQAAECAQAYGRDLDYPLWKSGAGDSTWATKPDWVQACNLDDGMLALVPELVKSFHGKYPTYQRASGGWRPITVTRQPYRGVVHSLDVEGDNTYVADGILTHNCAKWGTDRGWRVLAVEHAPVITLRTPAGGASRYKLKAKIDLVVQDVGFDNRIWVVDHKSGQNLPSNKELDLDDQFGLYVRILRRLGVPVWAAIYNAARTQRNKAPMALVDRMSRTRMPRQEAELDRIEEDAYLAASAAYGRRPVTSGGVSGRGYYSSPNPDTCKWRCDFTDVHLLARKGEDLERALIGFGFTQSFERH